MCWLGPHTPPEQRDPDHTGVHGLAIPVPVGHQRTSSPDITTFGNTPYTKIQQRKLDKMMPESS
jgi:hypothetical protein